MYNALDLNFEDILSRYFDLVKYLVRSSDSFSLITNQVKPFSKTPPNCEHDIILDPLKNYLINQIIGIKAWPGTITKDTHKVMNVYCSCKETEILLLNMPNIFTPKLYNFAEDISFYRKEKTWVETVSHEKMVNMLYPTKADILFLKNNCIRYL